MNGYLAFMLLIVSVIVFSRGSLGQSPSSCTATPSSSPATCTCSCAPLVFPFSCGGKSFFYKLDPSSYSIASATCAERGGRLVTLKSKKVNDCVEKVLRDEGVQTKDFWIGLARKTEGSPDLIWSDATPFTSGDFSNFPPGEPNNHGGNQNCMFIWGSHAQVSYASKWDDRVCDGRNIGYICESLTSVDDD